VRVKRTDAHFAACAAGHAHNRPVVPAQSGARFQAPSVRRLYRWPPGKRMCVWCDVLRVRASVHVFLSPYSYEQVPEGTSAAGLFRLRAPLLRPLLPQACRWLLVADDLRAGGGGHRAGIGALFHSITGRGRVLSRPAHGARQSGPEGGTFVWFRV
jgi:hypothetical protein